MQKWTKADKKFVRSLIEQLTAENSQAHLARLLDPAMDRRLVNNWYRRGSIPMTYHSAIIQLAAAAGISIKPSQLCLEGRISEKVLQRAIAA